MGIDYTFQMVVPCEEAVGTMRDIASLLQESHADQTVKLYSNDIGVPVDGRLTLSASQRYIMGMWIVLPTDEALERDGSAGNDTLPLRNGYSDDHTAWFRRTSFERYVEGLPHVVVMPNGQRRGYVDAVGKRNENYETYISSELVGFVDRTFHTIPEARVRALVGLSMGGYGSRLLAVKHPTSSPPSTAN